MIVDKKNQETLDIILKLIEVLKEIEDVDTLGNTISIKSKIVGKVEELLDTL